jgi:hypothetical protein
VLQPTAEPTPEAGVRSDIIAARQAALGLLREMAPTVPVPEDLAWVGRDTTPPGVSEVTTYEFASAGWSMTVAALTLSPGVLEYEVELDHAQSGLHWAARLDQSLRLLESNVNVSVDVVVARKILLDYLAKVYPALAPADGLVWLGEKASMPGTQGRQSFSFEAEGWSILVEHDLADQEQVVYEVGVTGSGNGFSWRGQVDAQGTVLEHR